MSRAYRVSLVVLLGCWAPRAAAHEVLHRVEEGRAVAVKVEYAAGEPLAYAEYSLFSPADDRIEHQKGRTDRNGYVTFVPEPPGRWHLRVIGRDGHGLDTHVDVAAGKQPVATSTPTSSPSSGLAARTIGGVAAVGVLFAALFVFYRRKDKGR